jgi:hypothetical protein
MEDKKWVDLPGGASGIDVLPWAPEEEHVEEELI